MIAKRKLLPFLALCIAAAFAVFCLASCSESTAATEEITPEEAFDTLYNYIQENSDEDGYMTIEIEEEEGEVEYVAEAIEELEESEDLGRSVRLTCPMGVDEDHLLRVAIIILENGDTWMNCFVTEERSDGDVVVEDAYGTFSPKDFDGKSFSLETFDPEDGSIAQVYGNEDGKALILEWFEEEWVALGEVMNDCGLSYEDFY